jgi:hypothetical protein
MPKLPGEYQIDLIAAAQRARQRMDAAIRDLRARSVPGDTYRNLEMATEYTAQTFKHLLVPIWLLSYTYGPRSFHVIVNGCTGTIAGDYPKGWIKIMLLVLTVVLVAALVFAILGNR